MKKFSKLLLVFVLALSLTGCVKIETTMEIGNDKKMTFTMVQVVDEKAINDAMKDFAGMGDDAITEQDIDSDTDDAQEDSTISAEADFEEVKSKLAQHGYTVEKYNENSMSGYKITKTFASIDEVSKSTLKVQDLMTISEDTFDHSHFFQKKSNLFKDTYTASYKFDMKDASQEGMDSSYNEMLGSSFDLKFIVKLPNKSVSNNATSVSEDGKTLTWDLKLGQENEVNFVFDFDNPTMLYAACGVFGLILVLLIVVVVVIMSKNKNKKGGSGVKPVESVTQVAPDPEVKPTDSNLQ